MREELDREAAEAALLAARELSGTVCRLSAALVWGWELKQRPSLPQITLRRDRRIAPARIEGVLVRRLDLKPSDVDGLVTTPGRTVVDCLRFAPYDEALAVADSALRGGFPEWQLAQLAREARGPRADRIKLIARLADGRAASPLESVLRWIALGVPGLEVEPQVSLGATSFAGRPDLVDSRLGIVIEADSFEFHGTRRALTHDMRRYNAFVVDGWLVLRFSFEDVMFRPRFVYQTLVRAVRQRTGQRTGQRTDWDEGVHGAVWDAR